LVDSSMYCISCPIFAKPKKQNIKTQHLSSQVKKTTLKTPLPCPKPTSYFALTIFLLSNFRKSSLISGPSSTTLPPLPVATVFALPLAPPLVGRLVTPFPLLGLPRPDFFASTVSTVRWNRLNNDSARTRVLCRSIVLLSSLTYLRTSSNCLRSTQSPHVSMTGNWRWEGETYDP